MEGQFMLSWPQNDKKFSCHGTPSFKLHWRQAGEGSFLDKYTASFFQIMCSHIFIYTQACYVTFKCRAILGLQKLLRVSCAKITMLNY